MKIIAGSILLFLLAFGASAQLIKKQPPHIPSHIDSVYLEDEHFRYETLDSVYRYMNAVYNVSITYDTSYCKRHYHSYWYMHTPLSRAIEITTHDQRLRFKIDSAGNVTIRRRGKLLDEDTITERPAPQVKYAGPPEKTHFNLTGKVIDFASGDPLPYVLVRVKDGLESGVADGNGRFMIPDVTADTVTLTAYVVGYEPTEIYLNPQISNGNLQIEMVPAQSTMLNETIITASKEVMQNSLENISTIKLTPQKLLELPNVGEKDVMRSLQLMPGVSAAHESSSGLYVRGGTPDQNLVLFDGFTVYHVDHLYGFFSAFNSNALKDIQLYKGGFDAKYGGRLSSVSEITGKPGDQRQFNMGADISLLSGNIFMDIPLSEKITITAAARRSWKGPIYNWIFDKLGNGESDVSQATGPFGATTKTTSYFFDVNTKVTYRASANDNISYSFFSSTDKVNKAQVFDFGGFGGMGGGGFRNNMTDYARYQNIGMSVQWMRKWSEKLNSQTTFAYSHYYSERDRTNARTTYDSATLLYETVQTGVLEYNNLKDKSANTNFDWNTFRGNTFSFGAFMTAFDISYTYSENDTSVLLDRKDVGLLAGGYLQDKQRFLGNRAELKAGIRESYYDVTGKYYSEPRLSASYDFTRHLSFKAAYGQYYQFANQITREDLLSGSTQFWILADGKNVPVAQSTHYIAGLSYDTRKYTFSAEGYYKQLQNITQYSLRFSTGDAYNESFFTGRGYSRGIELMAQKKTGKLTGWVSYTYGQARNQFDVYGPDYNPADQDVTNEFKAVAIYKYKRWDFSATWIYATGRPYTAPGGSYEVKLLDGTTKSFFTVTSENSMRLPDYHRLDVAVNRHMYNHKKKDVGYIGISLFNAYNHTNLWYKQYYITGSQLTESNVNYLGITPNLTISLKLH